MRGSRPQQGDARTAPGPPGGLRPRRKRLSRALGVTTAGALLGIVTVVAIGASEPALNRAVPGVSVVLAAVARWLPAEVAWVHDRGSPSLAAGVYFGWSDGADGELYLYGEGCGPAEAGDAVRQVELTGPTGAITVPGTATEQLWGALDRVKLHPYLKLTVVTERTMEFDRVAIRCRSGVEAVARVAAQVIRTPTPERASLDPSSPLGGSDPVSLPDVGLVAEYSFVTRSDPLTLVSFAGVPPWASTGLVTAAAGQPAAKGVWLTIVRPGGYAGPGYITETHPWSAAYQAPDDPRALRQRPGEGLDLRLGPAEAGILVVDGASFVTTPHPKPALLTPLIQYSTDSRAGVVVSPLVFGWTPTP